MPDGAILRPEDVQDYNELTNEQLRQVIKAELEANYPDQIRFPSRRLYWAEVKDAVTRFAELGWLAPGWPAEYGGMGLEPVKQIVMAQELERFGVARYQDHGVTQVGPVIIRFGTDAQRAEWLPGIVAGRDIWCQGYSEPDAGSDLAGLRTRALRDGDEYVIDGQKIWTTMAHDSTHMYTLVRTDPDAKKQAGISFVLIALDSPGITIRPIRDLAGRQEFCEVFLDSVRVPVGQRIGPENGGWTIAKSLLGHERINVGSPKQPEYALEMAVEVLRARDLLDDPVFRDRLAGLQLDVAHLGDAYARYLAMLARGEEIGPDVSMLKIWTTETSANIADLVIDAAGEAGGLAGVVDIAAGRFEVLAPFYRARPSMIFGGTNEIQRNIIATAVLGLPRS
jgi:alkylation response protein AidB-like acyl-CoA dehydrogenase